MPSPEPVSGTSSSDPAATSDPATPNRSPRVGALTVLLLASTLTVMAGAVLSPVVDLLRAGLGVSGTAAGLVVTAHGLSLAVLSPVVGWTIDRWGVRGPLAMGLLLYGVAGGAGLVVQSFPLLLVSRVIFGIGAAAVFSGTTVALLSPLFSHERDKVMGWRSAAMSAGGVTWPLVGGAVATASWHAPFGVYLVGIPLGLAALLVLPRGRRGRDDGAVAEKAGDADGDAGVRRRGLVLIYAIQVVATVVLYGVLVFLPIRLSEIGITATLVVATFTASLSLAMTLIGLGYARIRARTSPETSLVLAFAVIAVALVAMAVSAAWPLLLLAAFVCGLGMGVVVPVLTGRVGELSSVATRGRATSLLATATFGGQFLAPLVLGPIQATAGTASAFSGAAVLAVVVLAVVLVARQTRQRGNAVTPRYPSMLS